MKGLLPFPSDHARIVCSLKAAVYSLGQRSLTQHVLPLQKDEIAACALTRSDPQGRDPTAMVRLRARTPPRELMGSSVN